MRSPGEVGGRDQGDHDLPRGQVYRGDLGTAGEAADDAAEGAGRHPGDPSSGISDRCHDQDCLCVERHEVCDEDQGHEIAVEVQERNSYAGNLNVVTELEV